MLLKSKTTFDGVKMENKKRISKKLLISLAVALALVLSMTVFCVIYLSDYYRADNTAIDAFRPTGVVNEVKHSDGVIAFEPASARAALIFYPGGKVEYTAYIPLMRSLADNGILAILVDMPFNLAVFNPNRADGIKELYPDIDSWYIAGHSLGGSMAASYVASHTADFKGLVLLASYSTADLSASALSVLSIYGSEDGVMNKENYEANKINLPSDFTEQVIDGGCHAYFGMYGAQAGDGVPTVENTEQIIKTADFIAEFIK